MKSYGLIIDESLQTPRYIAFNTNSSVNNSFPEKKNLEITTDSYSTVVEQAITTKDKPLLKEIIIDCRPKTLENTIKGLSIHKVSSLLGLLEEFFNEDSRHINKYCQWLKELIQKHLSIILSNSENANIVSRLNRFIEKKASERDSLLKIKGLLQKEIKKEQINKFKPKFSYIQTQQQEHQNIENQNEEQMDFEDEFLDEDQ